MSKKNKTQEKFPLNEIEGVNTRFELEEIELTPYLIALKLIHSNFGFNFFIEELQSNNTEINKFSVNTEQFIQLENNDDIFTNKNLNLRYIFKNLGEIEVIKQSLELKKINNQMIFNSIKEKFFNLENIVQRALIATQADKFGDLLWVQTSLTKIRNITIILLQDGEINPNMIEVDQDYIRWLDLMIDSGLIIK